MAQKTSGYIELEWNCPNCGNKNAGMTKSCSACGSPQPQNVQFELGQKQELIKDAKKTAEAARGPDIYCPFCNTRNPAGSLTCLQCGGDMTEGIRRESGRVISGAPGNPGAAVTCSNCGTINPAGSSTCSACGASLTITRVPTQPAPTPAQSGAKNFAFRPWMALPVLGLLAMCCLLFGFLFFRTTDVMGMVQDVHWQRTIGIEAQREVTREDWRDQLPGGAKGVSCQQKYRRSQDTPVQGAREVCSTQLVDQGNGSAKVVESCTYEVYDDYCKYNALEWQQVDQGLAQGNDLNPYWPQINPGNGQREGARKENYTVNFQTKDGLKQFSTDDAALFAQLQPGTQWTLSVNTLGAIVKVSP
jgi:hypothetical protein